MQTIQTFLFVQYIIGIFFCLNIFVGYVLTISYQEIILDGKRHIRNMFV